MPKPMTKFRVEKVKEPLHSFRPIRNGSLAYCKYGSFATYANRTQAEKKAAELNLLGYDCYVRYQHPFIIILNEQY